MKPIMSAACAAILACAAAPAWAQDADPVPEAVETVEAETEATEAPFTDAEAIAAAAGPQCPPLLNEAGEPALDEAGEPVFDETPVPVLDEAGEPVIGEDGEAVTQACLLPGETVEDTRTEAAAAEDAAPQTALSPVMRLLNAGGPVIVILAVLAVLALGVGLVKFVQFLYLGVGRNGFVHRMVKLIKDGKETEAADKLETRRNPVARVMAASLRGKINSQMSDDLVREETTRVAQAQLDGLERGLALLSLIATIAPLLGLLGTVLGMIEAFQQMETVGDRVEPAVLAGGIWEALLTTAAGLSVAIPAAVFFTWLQRAVDVEAQRMEDAATQVFTVPLYDAEPTPAMAAE